MKIKLLENESLSQTKVYLINLLNKHQESMNYDAYSKFIEFGFSIEIDNQILGAVVCRQIDEIVHLEYLGVDEQVRGQHVGAQLMDRVERYAQENGCTRITLTTQDYQARGFYEACGYDVFGALEDTPKKGTTKFYMTKRM